MHPSRRSDRSILITEAGANLDEEFDRRRKRYLITMIIRALCVVGAACTFQISGWLAAGFVVGAMVLPWCAVLIANDRAPKQQVRFRRFLPGQPSGPQELTAAPEKTTEPREPRVIDI